MKYVFSEIINKSDGAKMVVTSVTNVTTMKNNKLSMLQGVTKCNSLLQNASFSMLVTQLLQLMCSLLQSNTYKSACNTCNNCNTGNIPLKERKLIN